MKKKISIIIGIVVGLILVFSGGYYFASRSMSSSKSTSNKVVTQQRPKEDNKIDGFDLGVLTKDEFHKAESLGQKYKGKSIQVQGINLISNSQDIFRQTYGEGFSIDTPYANVIDCTKEVAEKYLEINDKNVINKIKEDGEDLNIFKCLAIVGGDEGNFTKGLHIVLKVYGKEGIKVLQPKSIHLENESGLSEPSSFWPDSPSYIGGLQGDFDAKDVIALRPTKLEIIVIYPDGKEVKQLFDYDKLNQL